MAVKLCGWRRHGLLGNVMLVSCDTDLESLSSMKSTLQSSIRQPRLFG